MKIKCSACSKTEDSTAGAQKTYTCCICGRKFIGFGNNPWPIVTADELRCCNECNACVVIPARIVNMRSL